MTGEDYEAAKPTAARTRVTGDPWVSGHMPECDWAKDDETCHVYEGWGERTYDEHRDPAGRGICTRCQAVCICSRLRACEQRVHDHYSNLAPVGFVLGVQAARDAVAALPYAVSFDIRVIAQADTLTAIDALRGSGKPDTPPSAEKGEKP